MVSVGGLRKEGTVAGASWRGQLLGASWEKAAALVNSKMEGGPVRTDGPGHGVETHFMERKHIDQALENASVCVSRHGCYGVEGPRHARDNSRSCAARRGQVVDVLQAALLPRGHRVIVPPGNLDAEGVGHDDAV